jgi:subtilisin family serine protease
MNPNDQTNFRPIAKYIKQTGIFVITAALLSYCGTRSDEKKIDGSVPVTQTFDLHIIPKQYVVILKEKPVLKDGKIKDSDRKRQNQLNNSRRKTKKDKVKALVARYNVKTDTSRIYTDLVVGFKAKLETSEYQNLKSDPEVENVYPDFEVRLRNPIQQSEPIASRNPIQQDWDFTDTNRRITCAVAQTNDPKNASGKATVVWVLDTGVQPDHEDLNVWNDPELAVSFIPGETTDGNGHGTHIAGIIGAYENNIGATGVSSGARIIPVKVLENSGSGRWSYLLEGLEHVSRYNSVSDVVNLSLGAYGVDLCDQSKEGYRILKQALLDLAQDNTFIVIAAGNDGADARNSLPGCINGNNIFTVAAMNCDTTCAGYSNFGPPVDWIAVGSNVFSTFKDNNYRIMSGTSMAAAVVSGVVHANGRRPKTGDSKQCGTPPRSFNYALVD